MTFTLRIELGNDAMQDGYDVAKALAEVALKLRSLGKVEPQDSGRIADLNGNTVGRWEVKP